MPGEEKVPTNADVDAALRLSRKYLYDGNEPYAPAIMSIARMLMAYREELGDRGISRIQLTTIELLSRLDRGDGVSSEELRTLVADSVVPRCTVELILQQLAEEQLVEQRDGHWFRLSVKIDAERPDDR